MVVIGVSIFFFVRHRSRRQPAAPQGQPGPVPVPQGQTPAPMRQGRLQFRPTFWVIAGIVTLLATIHFWGKPTSEWWYWAIIGGGVGVAAWGIQYAGTAAKYATGFAGVLLVIGALAVAFVGPENATKLVKKVHETDITEWKIGTPEAQGGDNFSQPRFKLHELQTLAPKVKNHPVTIEYRCFTTSIPDRFLPNGITWWIDGNKVKYTNNTNEIVRFSFWSYGSGSGSCENQNKIFDAEGRFIAHSGSTR